ncbi:Uncharacterized protein PCOAH_00012070 [Plasmodium coatneyi]|uniref:Uncharacterized protein n=1 Tax=Plasmodium coatneyi TaxID=208452 RepID=A0A1B1DVM3_9APIC|nr:Uncharacterized protein PCOAH_00012070 [Plasmodium coatneyi]ANQ06841.1 Uncharacterized protein PCOAH_00012070 [Plasmodium coatneyi]
MVHYSCGFLLSLLGAFITLVVHDHGGFFFQVVNCNIRVLNHGKGGHKTSGQQMQHHLGASNPTEVGKLSAVEKGDTQSKSNMENELEDNLGNEDDNEGEMSRSSSLWAGLLSEVSPHNAGKTFQDDMDEEDNPDELPSNHYTFFDATNDRSIKKVDSLSQPDQQKLLQQNFNWAQMPNIGISCRETGCPKTYQMCVPFSYDSANFEGKRLIEIITSSGTFSMKGLKFDNENIEHDKRKYILVYSCVCKKYRSDGSCDESVE